ncbi:unnamed protein product [Camellia sinensis]
MNYVNETVSQSAFDDKGQGQTMERMHGMVGNEDVERTSSDKDFEIKMDGHYRSDGEPDDASRHQDGATESKSGSEYKNEDGSEEDSLDEREDRLGPEGDDGQNEADKVRRGQIDVPADEMLSDDYYEQDVDDQSDSLHYRW